MSSSDALKSPFLWVHYGQHGIPEAGAQLDRELESLCQNLLLVRLASASWLKPFPCGSFVWKICPVTSVGVTAPTMTVLLLMSLLKSSRIMFCIFGCSFLYCVHLCLPGFYPLVGLILLVLCTAFCVSCYGLCFESLLSEISIATPALFCFHLHGDFFLHFPSLSVCMNLLF